MWHAKAYCQIEVVEFSENTMEWIKLNKIVINKVKTNLINW